MSEQPAQTPEAQGQKKGNRRNLILIGAVAIVGFCALCTVVLLLLPDSNGSQEVANAPTQALEATEPGDLEQLTQEPATTDPPAPTDTPSPTETPQPTDTPIPTATPDPDLIEAGMHLIGTDIQPGLYRGLGGMDFFSSCYWERLSDVSGDLDAILANENAIGQFYIQIPETDFALDVDCEIRVFRPEENIVAEFPTQIDPGQYLIGVDIQPGMYRGQAGNDFENSCYWERVSDFTGELNGILANDNSTGQFFIQVGAGDFGLLTGCPLEFVPQ